MRMRRSLGAALAIALGGAGAARAQVPIPLTVSGNEAHGNVVLPGGITGELTISFESVVGLTPTSLRATARIANPLELIFRLPALVSVPLDFPVLIRISPAPGSTLSFSGVAQVALHTPLLHLLPDLPLGLDKSPNGGSFKDVTTWEAEGSYRVGGSTGGFSDFLIVLDLRSVDNVIVLKFNDLQAALNAQAGTMPPVVAGTLQTRLTEARTLYEAGDLPGAIARIASFSAYVLAHSGADIPDVWRANQPSVVNVAGILRSGADSLRFSLQRKAGP
jgi:uncharacterized protein DUF6689